jgi:hypothetical protein
MDEQMNDKPFFRRVKTTQLQFDTGHDIPVVIFESASGAFLAVVAYLYKQLKKGPDTPSQAVEHFTAKSASEAEDLALTWVKTEIGEWKSKT